MIIPVYYALRFECDKVSIPCWKFVTSANEGFNSTKNYLIYFDCLLSLYEGQVGPKPRETSVKLMALGPPDVLIFSERSRRRDFYHTPRVCLLAACVVILSTEHSLQETGNRVPQSVQ